MIRAEASKHLSTGLTDPQEEERTARTSWSLPLFLRRLKCESRSLAHKYTYLLTYTVLLRTTCSKMVDSHMGDTVRIQVLMPPEESERFEDYCRERGFKKSTLIVRLIREHLEQEKFKPQHELFEATLEGRKRP